MFNVDIVGSDAFLDLPHTAQALYFQLGMRADDDGFVGNPKTIQRIAGAKASDLELLVKKRFLLQFPSGVVVIKHWRINNQIQKDRYTPTVYTEEYQSLYIKDNKAYTEIDKGCIQSVSEMDTQISIDKDRLDKNRTGKGSKENKSGEYKITTEKCSSKNSLYKSKDSDNKENFLKITYNYNVTYYKGVTLINNILDKMIDTLYQIMESIQELGEFNNIKYAKDNSSEL